MDFFKMAALQGVQVTALQTAPQLSPEEYFYLEAFNILSGAGYADISAYCRDHGLTIDERSDLIQVLLELRNHTRKSKEGA
jgi:hypothetical protein